MPYSGDGTFSIPNSFTPNTTILSSLVNANFTDIATGLSEVLTLAGEAGMTAPLPLADGTEALPGLTFVDDPNTGIRRSDADEMRAVTGGSDAMMWDSAQKTWALGALDVAGAANFQGALTALISIDLGASDTTLTRSAAGVVAVEGNDLAKTEPGVNAQTGTAYTLALTDKGGVVTMNNANANTLTIPTNNAVAFPTGTVINVVQLGEGTTTITGDTGVTVNGASAGSGDISSRYQGVSLLKIGEDTWVASGAIGTVS